MVQNPDPLLTIGVFARRSRLSAKALRLYERSGILVPESVDDVNGYRRYRESQLRDARVVRLMRRLDMPLATVAATLALPRSQQSERVREFWLASLDRIARQADLAAHLQYALSGGKERYPMYEIGTRNVDAVTVLTEQRHIAVDKLPGWIEEAMRRQLPVVDTVGGQAGPGLVIYHGEVNEDSDGPVEVCLPIAPDAAARVAYATRVEPAHREAFTRITKAQVRFPDIMSAYDAVETWIAQNGETIVAPPREVYFTDFAAAGPDDEVVDIAFPIAAR